jgi:predicted dehydrogenase
MKNQVNYGIIGFGRYAENRLFPAFQKAKNSNLIAITKRDIGKAKAIAEKLNIPNFYNEPEHLLQQSDIDGVIVTSPPGLHMDHTVLAAKHGKHVMVEKPFAVNQSQAQIMVKTCKENNIKLMAAFVMRFIEAINLVRKWVLAGKLGDIQHVSGYFGIDTTYSKRTWLDDWALSGGGAVADLGSHFIDIIQYISESEIRIIGANLKPVPAEDSVEKNALISFELEQNIIGSLYVSFEVIRESGLTFHGSKGKLTLQNFNQADTMVNLVHLGNQGESSIQIHNSNYYQKMIDHFSQAIIENITLLTPGEIGLQNQKIIDEIYKISKK